MSSRSSSSLSEYSTLSRQPSGGLSAIRAGLAEADEILNNNTLRELFYGGLPRVAGRLRPRDVEAIQGIRDRLGSDFGSRDSTTGLSSETRSSSTGISSSESEIMGGTARLETPTTSGSDITASEPSTVPSTPPPSATPSVAEDVVEDI